MSRMCIPIVLLLTLTGVARAESTVATVDLYVQLHSPQPAASPGESVSVTVVLGNDGDFGVDEATVRVILDDTLTLLEATPAAGTFTPATGDWIVTDLASFATVELELTLQLSDGLPPRVIAELMAFDGSFGGYDVDSWPGNGEACEDDYAELGIAILGGAGGDAGAPLPPDCGPRDAGPYPEPCDGGLDYPDASASGNGNGGGNGGCATSTPGGGAGFVLLALLAPALRRRPRCRTSS